MKTETWQVQIWVDTVKAWLGTPLCKCQPTKELANCEAKKAKRYCWKTRVVKVVMS